MPIALTITEEHIARGVPLDSAECPLSICRADTLGDRPIVQRNYTRFIDPNEPSLGVQQIEHSAGVAAWVEKFDDRGRKRQDYEAGQLAAL